MKRVSAVALVVVLAAGITAGVVFGSGSGSPQTNKVAAPSAVILTVTNLNDSGADSLRQAIIDAVAGDTIEFGITGTITLTSGLLSINKDLTITGPGAGSLTIDGNASSRIFNVGSGATVSISGLTLTNGNSSAISNFDGTLTLNNVTVSGNSAGQGGGINNHLGMLTLNNSTVSGNSNDCGVGGGGITVALEPGTLTLNNSTVSGNSSSCGGGIYFGGATMRIKNTIIAGNSAPAAPDCFGSPTSLGYNLIGNDTGCGFTAAAGDLVGDSANPIDPVLGPLQDNGGPTETHALLLASPTDSPAIDAIPVADCVDTSGNPVTADQRGVSRPQGPACDIGAYELEVGPINSPPVADDQSVMTDHNTSLSITLTGSDPDSADTLSYSIDSLPKSGDLDEGSTPIVSTPHGLSGNTVTYTPNNSFSGSDQFTFEVNDGTTGDIGTISIRVKEAPTTQNMYVYSVKIVCVPHFGPASPALMPGKYRTAVNVHNPWDQPALIEKWVTLSNPQGIPPITGDRIHETLQPWSAFDVDCPHMRDQFGLPDGAKVPGGKGFMVIRSDRELDVVAVYTSRAETRNKDGVGTSYRCGDHQAQARAHDL